MTKSLRNALLALPVVVGTLATVAATAEPASATVRPFDATYRVWATNVNIRENTFDPTSCSGSPSVGNCPNIQGTAQPADTIDVLCQRTGQTIGGNPYWLNVTDLSNGATGWMASYYIDYPANRLPNVGDC